MTALKPCPFCGALANLTKDQVTGYFGPDAEHKRHCPIGNIDFREYADRAHAIREWNTRTPPAVSPASLSGGAEEEQSQADSGGALRNQIARDAAAFAALPEAEQTALRRELATIGCNPGIIFARSPEAPANRQEAGEAEALRHKLWMIACHATGGGIPEIEGIDRSTNDICVQISASRNEVFAHGKEVGAREALTSPKDVQGGGR